MLVRVKICGITNLEDALVAAEAGADALGFMFFAGSPRTIEFSAAAEIVRRLPPFITKVGVFVDAPADVVWRGLESGMDTLQFHGEEPPEFCRQFRVPVYKAFRMRDAQSLKQLRAYQTSAWLLDAYAPDKAGGTGQIFNWDLAVEATKLGRVILAGGLTPENVAEAVRKVRPYAVDVSSGVESAPGRKDATKIQAFIERARTAAVS